MRDARYVLSGLYCWWHGLRRRRYAERYPLSRVAIFLGAGHLTAKTEDWIISWKQYNQVFEQLAALGKLIGLPADGELRRRWRRFPLRMTWRDRAHRRVLPCALSRRLCCLHPIPPCAILCRTMSYAVKASLWTRILKCRTCRERALAHSRSCWRTRRATDR